MVPFSAREMVKVSPLAAPALAVTVQAVPVPVGRAQERGAVHFGGRDRGLDFLQLFRFFDVRVAAVVVGGDRLHRRVGGARAYGRATTWTHGMPGRLGLALGLPSFAR